MSKSDFTDLDDTRICAQEALNAMSRHGVLASPANFEIWSAYAAGASPELTAWIDKIIAEESGFPADVSRDIHDRFGDKDAASEQARLISAELLETLRYIQDAFDDTQLSQLEFHQRLDHYSERLESANGASDISRILEEIIIDTVQMREQTGDLKAKLAKSDKLVHNLHSRLEVANREALTDPLTDIPNRRYFEAEFNKAVAEAETDNSPLSLMFLDIDLFKDFNDKYGHDTGDNVLRLVARQIKTSVGSGGLACRYGGEEFVVLLKNTDNHTALVMAEKIRILISRKDLTHRKSHKSFGRITISCGVTRFRPGENPASFLERADCLLYRAKEAGRNRVMQSQADAEPVQKRTLAN